jgi:RND family efflux transporter MFP subunit
MKSFPHLVAAPVCLAALALLSGCGADHASAKPDAQVERKVERATLRVRVAPVERAGIGSVSAVSGVTEAIRTATVAAEAAGRVVERHVEPGARVAAGDPLLSIDSTLARIAVDEARATLRARDADRAEAARALDRGEELHRSDALSDSRHDAYRFSVDRAESARALAAATLRRAQRALEDTVVRAPFSGTVESIGVQVGDYLMPATPVATLADFSQVRLRAGVTASEAAHLKQGDVARVAIAALGGSEAESEIRSVGNIADPKSGTYPVEVWLDNPNGMLRAGMVGQLRLASGDASDGLLVPRAALLRRDGQLAVFVVEDQEGALRAEARPVELGRQAGDRVELLSGVIEGDRVVIDGLFALTDGAPVSIDVGSAAVSGAWSD